MPCAAFSAKGNGYHLGAGIVERGLFCFWENVMHTDEIYKPKPSKVIRADNQSELGRFPSRRQARKHRQQLAGQAGLQPYELRIVRA